ncbi:hypothetical protein LMH73_017745 [Vibrio splendidus]|nr:hypothetical protein [Vibrio splendidus]MCC4880367.1 hypothetical protein [Vibrio splendidus]
MISSHKLEQVNKLSVLDAREIGTVSKKDISDLLMDLYFADTQRIVSKYILMILALPFSMLAALELVLNGAQNIYLAILFGCLVASPFLVFGNVLRTRKMVRLLTVNTCDSERLSSSDYFSAYSNLNQSDKDKVVELVAKHEDELNEVSLWLSNPDRDLIYAELVAIERYDAVASK